MIQLLESSESTAGVPRSIPGHLCAIVGVIGNVSG